MEVRLHGAQLVVFERRAHAFRSLVTGPGTAVSAAGTGQPARAERHLHVVRIARVHVCNRTGANALVCWASVSASLGHGKVARIRNSSKCEKRGFRENKVTYYFWSGLINTPPGRRECLFEKKKTTSHAFYFVFWFENRRLKRTTVLSIYLARTVRTANASNERSCVKREEEFVTARYREECCRTVRVNRRSNFNARNKVEFVSFARIWGIQR